MAFSFGFYNALNHDRLYDAKSISQIFDGLITDGIYSEVGDRFKVKASSANNAVIVSSGRAWFNHTWSYNDADLQITGSQSDLILPRWDAIVIDIDLSIANRRNQLLWVSGTAASSPKKPTMIKTDDHKQYPLAYIYRSANVAAINESDISSAIGSDECPYVESILTDTKNIAPVEINNTSSKAYSKGQYLLWNNLLYKATVNILNGTRFVPYPSSGYNITRATIGEELFNSLSIDTTITSSSQHPVTSQAIYNALSRKFDIYDGGMIDGEVIINNILTVNSTLSVKGRIYGYANTIINGGSLSVSSGSNATSTITVGNTSSHAPGELQLQSNGTTTNNNYNAIIIPDDGYTTNRTFRLPNIDGTIGVVGENVLDKKAITYGTSGKTAGTSVLTTGYIYLQYE